MGFDEWFAEPFVNLVSHIRGKPEIVVVETSKEEFKKEFNLNPQLHKGELFQPRTFDQYIGQENSKEILKDYISAMKEREETLGHVLISGPAGTGKTTLARIIANNLNVKFKEVITSSLKNQEELLEAIEEVNGGILLLDEVHGLDRNMAESIYSIMHDFKYNGKEIKKFTLMGATTELGELIANREPFVERFKIPIELEDYKTNELAVMSEQYRLQMFPYDPIDDIRVYELLAKNSRRNPRSVIRLTEALIYMKSTEKVFRNFKIIKNGYTHKDLKVLKYIQSNEKGVGLQGISSYLAVAQATYMHKIEPFLVQEGLILRTPRGRRISDLGKQKIEELEKELCGKKE